jgi:hypothetical protein
MLIIPGHALHMGQPHVRARSSFAPAPPRLHCCGCADAAALIQKAPMPMPQPTNNSYSVMGERVESAGANASRHVGRGSSNSGPAHCSIDLSVAGEALTDFQSSICRWTDQVNYYITYMNSNLELYFYYSAPSTMSNNKKQCSIL